MKSDVVMKVTIINVYVLTNKPSILEPEKPSFHIKWERHARKPVIVEIAETLKTQTSSLSQSSAASANSSYCEMKLMKEKLVRAVQS